MNMRCEGQGVTLRQTELLGHSVTLRATEIDVEIPRAPFALFLQRQGNVRSKALDLVVGDPRFDEAFVVEGTPGDVVRRLLDKPARDFFLTQHAGFTLSTRARRPREVWDSSYDAMLRVTVLRWFDTTEEALAVIQAVARIAARVAEIVAEVEQEATATFRST